MSETSIRTLTVGVSLTILDRATALATARADLVRAGEAAPGQDASDLLRDGDDVALLTTLANPWRLVDGAEATDVTVREEDGDHVVEVTFAVLDENLVGPSVAARFAGLDRDAPLGTVAQALLLLLGDALDRPGVEVQDAYVIGEDDEGFDFDAILAAAARGDAALPLAA